MVSFFLCIIVCQSKGWVALPGDFDKQKNPKPFGLRILYHDANY